MASRNNLPPSAEDIERANRQPGAKGSPDERGPTPKSADPQPEESLKPEHRRKPSGLLDDASHRPGPRDRRERKP